MARKWSSALIRSLQLQVENRLEKSPSDSNYIPVAQEEMTIPWARRQRDMNTFRAILMVDETGILGGFHMEVKERKESRMS